MLATLAVQRLPGEQSLGRYAVAVPTEHGLPGIWHAPLLSDPQCVAALRRANAPFLLIGGIGSAVYGRDQGGVASRPARSLDRRRALRCLRSVAVLDG